ncbi:MAG: Gfo/Idh/MocA family protein [Planctomycetota bacterium]|jgi:predicted dehydrogenase
MEKFDAAIFGLGRMGHTHIRAAVESPHIEKIYGFDPAEEQHKEAAEKGVIISSLEEIMNNPEIKLVYIASINAAHSEQAAMALKAGKAVLCEKPMGETLKEAEEMIKVEKETGTFLQIGFELHYSKIYQMTKEWIDKGLIGDVVNCHCRYYCSEFHLKNTWRSNSKGTLIGEKLSHYLDLQRWFAGSKVDEVYAMSAPNAVEYFNHPDNHQINMRYENGAISNLKSQFCNAYRRDRSR